MINGRAARGRSLEGRRVLITGATSGIGLVTARKLVSAGAAMYGPFLDSAPSDYEQTIRTTLPGVVHTAHAALPHLARPSGTLVVVGSVAGRGAYPGRP